MGYAIAIYIALVAAFFLGVLAGGDRLPRRHAGGR